MVVVSRIYLTIVSRKKIDYDICMTVSLKK